MNARALVEEIARAQMERYPMLAPEKALELAEIAAAVVDEPTITGSGLNLCRVCRAPRREREPSS